MRNFKLLLIIMVILSMGISMVGCSNNDSLQTYGDQKMSEEKAEEVASYLAENLLFQDFMSQVDQEIFLELYNLDADAVEDAALYSSTGATAEEIAVIKATEGNKEVVLKACEDRILWQKESFENYVPEELDKLGDPFVLDIGNTIIFVVCDDRKSVGDVLENYGNIEI